MNYRILIIEDETETSKYLSKALIDEGFSVECAENGFAGIEKLNSAKFDLIILDLKMPGKSGDEVLKEIREIDPYILVIVNTNYGDISIMQKLINIGVDGFLQKGDLWKAIEFIKSKFYPIDDEKRKVLLDNLLDNIHKTSNNEIFA